MGDWRASTYTHAAGFLHFLPVMLKSLSWLPSTPCYFKAKENLFLLPFHSSGQDDCFPLYHLSSV